MEEDGLVRVDRHLQSGIQTVRNFSRTHGSTWEVPIVEVVLLECFGASHLTAATPS